MSPRSSWAEGLAVSAAVFRREAFQKWLDPSRSMPALLHANYKNKIWNSSPLPFVVPEICKRDSYVGHSTTALKSPLPDVCSHILFLAFSHLLLSVCLESSKGQWSYTVSDADWGAPLPTFQPPVLPMWKFCCSHPASYSALQVQKKSAKIRPAVNMDRQDEQSQCPL